MKKSSVNCGLKGRRKIAQGNALGMKCELSVFVLKGQHKDVLIRQK